MNISVPDLSDVVVEEALLVSFVKWRAESHCKLVMTYLSSSNLFNTELCNILAVEINLKIYC